MKQSSLMKNTILPTLFRYSLPTALTIGATLCISTADVKAAAINCLSCGNVPLVTPNIDGTVSFAVISGANFNAELATHGIGFFGFVPQGTLGPIVNPAPNDFVYMYQLVNDGPDLSGISSWSISGGGISAGAITAGTRLESTLLVDPLLGLVSRGPAGGTTGLSAGPSVELQNGFGPPLPTDPVPSWGPCVVSGPAGVQCSDAQADLLPTTLSPTSVQISNWQETPSGTQLDAFWSGSIIWMASPFAPVTGTTSISNVAGFTANANIPVPGIATVPEPTSLLGLLTLGTLGTALTLKRKLKLKP